MRKLTLRRNKELIRRAKAIAKRRGKSISKIVAENFSVLGSPYSREADELAPTVRSLKGILKGPAVGQEEYHRHLEGKFL